MTKLRWRGIASNGREFGFDLDHAMKDGVLFYREEKLAYVIRQTPEPLLEIPFSGAIVHAATLSWQIGNLHFPVQVLNHSLRTVDDPALRQMLLREGISFQRCNEVFHPLTAAAHHGHHAH